MQSYEVEIKALLGTAARADEVRTALKELDPECEMCSHSSQLNHYFEPIEGNGSLERLAEIMASHLSDDMRNKLADLSSKAKSFSVRTRDKDGIVILVVKASVDDTTSHNGITRMEFEASVPLSLIELDNLVMESGFAYQAKWSREREEYVCRGITICLDKNAGYGYLAEFERVVDDEGKLEEVRQDIRALMTELGVAELAQDRLERMFAFYNAHWPEYYGTDKIFVIE